MRIWLVPSAFFPHRGGVEELTLQLACALAAAGDEVSVITHRYPVALPEWDVVEGIDMRRIHFSAPRHAALALARFPGELRAVQRALDELTPRPALINVQCVSNQVAHLLLYARRHHIPLVVSTQGEVVMDAGAIFQRSAYMRLMLRVAARRASALTACSAWTAMQTGRFAHPFAQANVIPNGVEPSQWNAGPLPERPVLCAWGRHVPQKGFDLALSAFALLREQRPDARLLIGGDGPETASLRALAGDGVEFVGALDRDGVRALLGRSRIAVVPSRIEPFGIVSLEALAAGRGLVYAAGTGIAEAAGALGRAVDVSDPRAFADAMTAELVEPTPASAGRGRAAELSWEQIGARYRFLYQRVLGLITG